jgi:hypothetical protein
MLQVETEEQGDFWVDERHLAVENVDQVPLYSGHSEVRYTGFAEA